MNKTFAERVSELDKTEKEMIQRLVGEVIIGSKVIDEHIIDKDNGTLDALGTIIFNRTQSAAYLLAGMLHYEDDKEVIYEILKITK